MQDDNQCCAKKKKTSHLIIFIARFIYTKAQSHFQSHFRPNPRLQVLPRSSEQIYGVKWLKSSLFEMGQALKDPNQQSLMAFFINRQNQTF